MLLYSSFVSKLGGTTLHILIYHNFVCSFVISSARSDSCVFDFLTCINSSREEVSEVIENMEEEYIDSKFCECMFVCVCVCVFLCVYVFMYNCTHVSVVCAV